MGNLNMLPTPTDIAEIAKSLTPAQRDFILFMGGRSPAYKIQYLAVTLEALSARRLAIAASRLQCAMSMRPMMTSGRVWMLRSPGIIPRQPKTNPEKRLGTSDYV